MAVFIDMETGLNVLHSSGAECDESGSIMIFDAQITVGMGGDEIIIPDETKVRINGEMVQCVSLFDETHLHVTLI